MSRTFQRRHRGTPQHVVQIRERRVRPAPEPQGRAAPEPSRISDHAVLKWIERVLGMDLRAGVEAEIYAEGRADLIARIGSGRLKLAQPHVVLLIRNGIVVSVLPGDK